jgi:spore coat polysaccharide biosynthesis protein SpsF
MRVVAIIQARMGSTRLPGKILKPLAGRPVLWHVVDRLRHADSLDGIGVATTSEPADEVVESFCEANEIPCFRGSENDVLDRYYRAAKLWEADPVVRITADCPVIDPEIVDEVVSRYVAGSFDVYGLAGEFPDGLDVTVFRFSALERAAKAATLPSEREHVGPYMLSHPELFRLGEYRPFRNLGHHRWTLDEAADLRFLELVFEKLYRPGETFG